MYLSPAVTRVRRSYRRCKQNRGFFIRFYRRFMRADPRIAALFAGVDMQRQHGALRHGLNLAVMYAEGRPVGEMGMRRICEIHSSLGGALTPDLYAFWIESLVRTVAETDPAFDAVLERDWRDTMGEVVKRLQRAPADAGAGPARGPCVRRTPAAAPGSAGP